MRAVAPKVKTIELAVEFLDRQDYRLVAGIGRCFKASQRQRPLRTQYNVFTSVAWLVEEDEKHGVEYRHFDVQLDQSGEAIDGFSITHGLGAEVDFSTLASGRIMTDWLQSRIGSTASDFNLRL